MQLLEAALLRGAAYHLPLPSLWPCLATLLAALLALWRKRTSSVFVAACSAPPPPPAELPPPLSLQLPLPPPAACKAPAMGVCRKEVLFAVYGDCGDGVEEEEEDGGGGDDGEEEEKEEEVVGMELRLGLGSVVERWRGDLGWYMHQDMAAIDGSVVRLWEEERRSMWRRRRRAGDTLAC